MEQRSLGSSDLLVSAVGMGCNNFSRPGTATESLAGSTAVIHAAVDAGVTFFDGADIYGGVPGRSEEFLGAALKGRRDQVVLATKFGHSGYAMPGAEAWGAKGSASYVTNAVEASLTRLGTDRIDLLQMHTPDDATPVAETLAALTDLVAAGKVRHVGCSNFSAAQLREAAAVSDAEGFVSFVSVQNEFSLLARDAEVEVLPTAVELGVGFLPYFPLANGLLTGKYTRTGGSGRLTAIKPELLAQADWDRLEAFRALTEAAGVSMLEATFAWLLAHRGVSSVIAGATTPEQVAANVGAGQAEVPDAVVQAVDELFAR